jgi:hypothetical protein
MSNYAELSGATQGSTVVVMCAIDNLVGVPRASDQWMNRILGQETAGLLTPAPGWT